jgi:hypothetical protein
MNAKKGVTLRVTPFLVSVAFYFKHMNKMKFNLASISAEIKIKK